jgi:YHS domain-containing protein
MLVKSMMLTVAFLFALTIVQDDSKKDELAGIKCVVLGTPAKKDKSAKYKDGEVYFCCDKCKAAFEKDPDKFATKANHQLVATGQYVQKNCPMSGKPIAKDTMTKVGAVEVGFCCENCKKTVEGAADLEAKSELVFAEKPFKNAFVKKTTIDLANVKCLMMPEKLVDPEQSVDYMDGKVYFCCKGCKAKFAKDNAKYAAQANQQLVATGQYVQKACPISGEPIDEDQTVEVGGTKVGFCCGKCVASVKGAADDAARSEMVFSADHFEKGFEKKQ